MFFRDPFRLVPGEKLAELADKLTRNEILTSNEVRAIIGYKPVDDPRADELRNSNINQKDDQTPQQQTPGKETTGTTPDISKTEQTPEKE